MNSLELADVIAEPIGKVGMAYYFCPLATERAEAAGSNAAYLYAAGRGGVLGDCDPTEVEEAFFFFNEGMVAHLTTKGRESFTPAEAAAAHLDVANEFARTTFGAIDEDVLVGFSSAAAAVLAAAPRGRWPLVDGYLALTASLDPDAEAYYWSIVLRELRGANHIDAVTAVGLTAAQACQLDSNPLAYPLHGYTDEQRSEATPELVAARAAAERDTSVRMAALFDVLDDAQRDALATGAAALFAALPADAG